MYRRAAETLNAGVAPVDAVPSSGGWARGGFISGAPRVLTASRRLGTVQPFTGRHVSFSSIIPRASRFWRWNASKNVPLCRVARGIIQHCGKEEGVRSSRTCLARQSLSIHPALLLLKASPTCTGRRWLVSANQGIWRLASE